MYRIVSAEPGPSLTIRYGPFPLAWWKLAVAPLLWFLAFGLGIFAEIRVQIDCEPTRCVVESSRWRLPPLRHEGGRDLLTGADGEDRTRHKDKSWHVSVRVHLSKGRFVKLEQEPQAEADRIIGQVNDFIAGKRASFHYDSGDRWWLRPASWLVMLAGAALVVDALRRQRPLKLRLEGRTITVDELGWLRRRTQRATVRENARDVAVDWRLLNSPGPRTAAEWGATLEVRNADGSVTPLTTLPREGLMIHYEAAAALRHALDLPASGPIGAHCPDAAATGPRYGGLPVAVLSMAWAGLCCGSLAGIALYAFVLLLVNPRAAGQNADESMLVAAAVGAVGLAALLVAIVWGRDRERARYRAMIEGRGSSNQSS